MPEIVTLISNNDVQGNSFLIVRKFNNKPFLSEKIQRAKVEHVK